MLLVLVSGLGGPACKNGAKETATVKPIPSDLPAAMRTAARPATQPSARPEAKRRASVAAPKPPRLLNQPQGTLIAHFVRQKRRNMRRVFSSSINNDSWVTIEMTNDGKVTLTDKGKRVDRVTYMRKAICQSQAEVKSWHAEYKGTWKKKGQKLVIKTKRVKNRCTQVRKCDNRPPERKKCEKISRRLTLSCTLGTITLRSRKSPIPAWKCNEGRAKAHTSRPWNFGQDQCVERWSGTRGPFHYNPCLLNP